MSVSTQAFLAIESSLSARLVGSWEDYSRPLLQKVWTLMKEGRVAEAIEVANAIDLEAIAKDNLDYINYLGNAALLFGATRVMPDARLTQIARGRHGHIVINATALLTKTIVQNVEDVIRIALLEKISAWDLADPTTHFAPSDERDIMLKYDPTQVRVPAGQAGGGQWAVGAAPLENSLGYHRADMPQIATVDYPEFWQFVKDRGITITHTHTLASNLKPAQNEYNPLAVKLLPPEKAVKPVIISEDHYILDGTHRWMYHKNRDEHAKVDVIRIGMRAHEAIKMMFEFPKVHVRNVQNQALKYDENQPRDEGGKWVSEGTEKISSLHLNADGEATAKSKWVWEPNYRHTNTSPVTVVRLPKGKLYVLDGYHRVEQARRDGKKEISYREVAMTKYLRARLVAEKVMKYDAGQVEKADLGAYVEPFQTFQGDIFSTAGNMLEMTSALHTSRLSAFGFTVEAEVRNLGTYKINAQLDNRICPICEILDGREFPVESATKLLRDALGANDPNDLKTIQPWPPQDKRSIDEISGLSDEELIARGWNVPPFHPWCRCILVKTDEGTPASETPSALAAEGRNYPLQAGAVTGAALADLTTTEINAARDAMSGLSGEEALKAWESLKAEGYTTAELEDIFEVTEVAVLAGQVQFQN